jgi:hypothetical protein
MSANSEEDVMTEKLPLIVSVKEREPTKVSAEGRPFEEFEVDTTDGPMLLQLTSKATDDLRGMLNTPPSGMAFGGTLKP